MQPVGGWLSDIGRKTLLVFFGVGGVLYSWYLITQLPHQHDATLAFLTLALAFVILTGYTSINAVVKAELFHPRAHSAWAWAMRWPTRCSAAPPRCCTRAR